MAVEVVTPEEFMGDVIGDLNRRRGRIEGMEPRGNTQVIRAFVPLAQMFGYATDLRSQTQGRATYTMQFDHYAEMPSALAEEITEHRSGTPVRRHGVSRPRVPRVTGCRHPCGIQLYFSVGPRPAARARRARP